MSRSDPPAVQMAGITKIYPGDVVANDHVSLEALRGTIHAVVGENGAGKSTLLGVLYGAVTPDEGRIRLHGEEADIRSPADAIRLGVGMVPQHSAFIPALTLIENALLGKERTAAGLLDRRRAQSEMEKIAADLEMQIPWQSRAAEMSVATLQKAEIVKTLDRGATIIILDEPTAMLAPQEAEALYGILRHLASSGRTVIVVTHRLQEVIDYADRVTVLRRGQVVAETDTTGTSVAELAALVVGGPGRHRSGGPLIRDAAEPSDESEAPHPFQPTISRRDPWTRGMDQQVRLPVLEVRDVVLPNQPPPNVSAITFEVCAGELLGIAGVDGSGQRELAEIILGLRPCPAGRVLINGRDMTTRSVAQRLAAGLAYCPEDRHRDGLILSFSVAENLLLGHQWDRRMGGGTTTRWQQVRQAADEIVRRHNVQLVSVDDPLFSLSGGNQQKVLIARALAIPPAVLIAMQPTRGLDIHASQEAYDSINRARASGMGVLLFSLDLDELLAVSDRIAVLYSGRLAGIMDRAAADRSTIGHMMTTGSLPS